MHACVSCLLTYNSDRISQRQINRANQPATTPTDFYRRTIYLPLLDAVITDMQSRFSDETITNFNDLAYFIPAVTAQLTKVPLTALPSPKHVWLILFYEIKWNQSVICSTFYECEGVLQAVVDV